MDVHTGSTKERLNREKEKKEILKREKKV